MTSLFPPLGRVSVLIPLPLSGPYEYLVADDLDLAVGDFVMVPLGPNRRIGVVWAREDHVPSDLPESKLKAVLSRYPHPPLPDNTRKLVDWIAAYTLQPAGAVLKMCMSVPDALEPVKPKIAYIEGVVPDGLRMTPARKRVMALATEGLPRTANDLALEAGVSPSVVKSLADVGGLQKVTLDPGSGVAVPDWARPGMALSADQTEAAEVLIGEVKDRAGSVVVLDGVPGAGKTEVYFEAVAECLRQGQQALVLLPEISLSAQWFDRFVQRFGVEPAVWHSDIGQARRRAVWRGVIRGDVKVVVGARSALMLPYPDLGLIIVDEEHDASYKQEEGVIYNARDMAVVRGKLESCPVVLASATPSLETSVNMQGGKYKRLHLPSRHGGAILPSVEAVDLRKNVPEKNRWLSPPVVEAVEAAFERGEQAMLFLNRRGYAPLTLCRACGHRLQCPSCTAWLVEHRRFGRLQCHHCGFNTPLPKTCPNCGAEEKFAACGPGVERLAEEVSERFPDKRSVIAASDTMTSPTEMAKLVHEIEEGRIDLVIGTQIVAKGYHFPNLTFVGVVDADLGLGGGDLRASERTFQLLYQVAGRAGRSEKPGHVMLQTHMPEHPVLQALVAGDRDRFVDVERQAREAAGMPPYGRLAALIISGENEIAVDELAAELGRKAPHGSDFMVLGPAPAPLSMIRGRHRRRFLVKTSRNVKIQDLVENWLTGLKPNRNLRVTVDIDPYSFL